LSRGGQRNNEPELRADADHLRLEATHPIAGAAVATDLFVNIADQAGLTTAWSRIATRWPRPPEDRWCDCDGSARLAGVASYCCGIPAASRPASQRLNSRAMCSPNSSGVEPRTTTPAVVRRFCTTSSPRLSLIVLLSLAMISRGTPRGVNTPYHVVTS